MLMAIDLTCEASVTFCYDPTGQNAQECGAASFACVDCGGPAGCPDHAHRCYRCDEMVCEECRGDHARAMIYYGGAAA